MGMGGCADRRNCIRRRGFFHLSMDFGNELPGSLCFELDVGKLDLLLIPLGLLECLETSALPRVGGGDGRGSARTGERGKCSPRAHPNWIAGDSRPTPDVVAARRSGSLRAMKLVNFWRIVRASISMLLAAISVCCGVGTWGVLHAA